jgi:hypothetical protein
MSGKHQSSRGSNCKHSVPFQLKLIAQLVFLREFDQFSSLISAVIGEFYSRNTLTMAVPAAVSGVLHCAPLSISPALSNKADYPTTIRTQVANICKFHYETFFSKFELLEKTVLTSRKSEIIRPSQGYSVSSSAFQCNKLCRICSG